MTATTTEPTTTEPTTEKANELTIGQQVTNLLLGADFLLRIILSIPWTIQMWIVQSQRAQRAGKRFIPQLSKSLLFYDTGCSAQDILKAYHIHNMHFGASLELVNGNAELVHAVLVPASQFDYADGVLSSAGVRLLSQAGRSRGYSFTHPPAQRRAERTHRTQRSPGAKLGKTYR